MFYIPCINIVKIVTVIKGHLDFIIAMFIYNIYVLICLSMATVQTETCSTHVKARFE
jgi:hypothetical protein